MMTTRILLVVLGFAALIGGWSDQLSPSCTKWVVPAFLGACIVLWIYESRRFKRAKEALFHRHGGHKPDHQKVKETLSQLNKETEAYIFHANKLTGMVFRGREIILARGQVGFAACGRYGMQWWRSDERVFIICDLEQTEWADKQRDVFERACVGSKAAVYWIRNIPKMADEMGKPCHPTEAR